MRKSCPRTRQRRSHALYASGVGVALTFARQGGGRHFPNTSAGLLSKTANTINATPNSCPYLRPRRTLLKPGAAADFRLGPSMSAPCGYMCKFLFGTIADQPITLLPAYWASR